MKKIIVTLITLLTCVSAYTQVNLESGYATDFTIRGTSRATNTAVVGITGIKDVSDKMYVYGFNYFVPTKRQTAQNHTGLGLSYYADLDEWSFMADFQGNYHLTQTPTGNSIEFGTGLTFYNLPYINKFANISLYYWDDIDLNSRGIEVSVSKRFANVGLNYLNVIPKASVYVFNTHTAYAAQIKVDYSKFIIRPFAELSYMNNDAIGSLALDNDYQAYVGLSYKF